MIEESLNDGHAVSIYNRRKSETHPEICEKQQIGFPEYNQEAHSMYREVLSKNAQQNSYYFLDGDNAI